jgi:hypothetical protein
MDSALPITCFYLFRRGENAVVDWQRSDRLTTSYTD